MNNEWTNIQNLKMIIFYKYVLDLLCVIEFIYILHMPVTDKIQQPDL